MDYAELLMEVRQRTGVAGAIERGSYYVANAERMLEKQIKTAAMQTTADLATDAGPRHARSETAGRFPGIFRRWLENPGRT